MSLSQQASPPRELIRFYGYFIWAHRMRVLFDKALRTKMGDSLLVDFDKFYYMSHWYAGIQCCIEAWRELSRSLGLRDTTITTLLRKRRFSELLREYRNAVYHFISDLGHPNILGFVGASGSAEWIHHLTDAFEQYFIKELKIDMDAGRAAVRAAKERGNIADLPVLPD